MHVAIVATFLHFLLDVQQTAGDGILFPRASETREVLSLNGLWNFVAPPYESKHVGYTRRWYRSDLDKLQEVDSILMPVPSSYNDVTQEAGIRDHVGLVWYDRKFFVPKSWRKGKRVYLRFSSVSYAAQVWVNGELAMAHEFGHLPFQREITSLLRFGGENRVTVSCDNTLLSDTVPQGSVQEVSTDNGKKLIQSYTFDFFNYAGIHRPVTLHTTPYNHIEDITVTTEIDDIDLTAHVNYNISCMNSESVYVNVTLEDKEGRVVAVDDGLGYMEGTLYVPEAKLWWPYLMHSEPGYLYTLVVCLCNEAGEQVDVYRQPVGIRTIGWTNTQLLINNKPIYLQGFGRHEDADVRGKGLDLAIAMKDYNLIRWIGGNVFRTSHYPYAEEIMDLADQFGIMVIDECPSADTDHFSDELLVKHKRSLTELYNRDKNRPAVIAWSIANEPRTQTEKAGEYFEEVANHTRILDNTRPITLAVARDSSEDKSGPHMDIISFNRYNAWYSNGGQLDMIVDRVVKEATSWHEKFNKPVIMSEYGADTMPGLHLYPEFIWSEEFQVALYSKHFRAFDKLREKEWFIGEFVWNFADFKTSQSYTRVGGNRKGIFTRDRQPKSAAHILRKRYFLLANELYNTTLPDDLFYYIAPNDKYYRDEL